MKAVVERRRHEGIPDSGTDPFAQAELDEAACCAIAMGGASVRMFYQECLRWAQGGGRQKAERKCDSV